MHYIFLVSSRLASVVLAAFAIAAMAHSAPSHGGITAFLDERFMAHVHATVSPSGEIKVGCAHEVPETR